MWKCVKPGSRCLGSRISCNDLCVLFPTTASATRRSADSGVVAWWQGGLLFLSFLWLRGELKAVVGVAINVVNPWSCFLSQSWCVCQISIAWIVYSLRLHIKLIAWPWESHFRQTICLSAARNATSTSKSFLKVRKYCCTQVHYFAPTANQIAWCFIKNVPFLLLYVLIAQQRLNFVCCLNGDMACNNGQRAFPCGLQVLTSNLRSNCLLLSGEAQVLVSPSCSACCICRMASFAGAGATVFGSSPLLKTIGDA